VVEEGRWRVESGGQIRVIAAFSGAAAHPGETDRGIAQQPG